MNPRHKKGERIYSKYGEGLYRIELFGTVCDYRMGEQGRYDYVVADINMIYCLDISPHPGLILEIPKEYVFPYSKRSKME